MSSSSTAPPTLLVLLFAILLHPSSRCHGLIARRGGGGRRRMMTSIGEGGGGVVSSSCRSFGAPRLRRPRRPYPPPPGSRRIPSSIGRCRSYHDGNDGGDDEDDDGHRDIDVGDVVRGIVAVEGGRGGEGGEGDEGTMRTTRRRVIFLSAATAATTFAIPPSPFLPRTPKMTTGGISVVANAAASSYAETTTAAAGEGIRSLSSRVIPGLGPTDVYYPHYFMGKWMVTRAITNTDDEYYYGVTMPIVVTCEMRFVKRGGWGGDGGGGDDDDDYDDYDVIADRSFNERSYHDALTTELLARRRRTARSSPETTMTTTTTTTTEGGRGGGWGGGIPAIRSLDWTPSDPNVLCISYDDGSSREIRVTKRTYDVSRDGNGVFSSEFRRIVDVPPTSSSGGIGGIGGIPSIYKSRVLTKWKRGDNVMMASGGGGDDGGVNIIEGIEIEYNERGTLGDRRNVDALFGGGVLGGVGGGGGGMGRNPGTVVPIPSRYGSDTKDLPDWRSTKTNILMERVT
ncbi:hypothetical protein ACHAXA_000254 [Cyclostephanos tholiformis]|uniref:DUF6816 domain-containing protein n=1 Tax=Cyclostephanos tholiformis TaxID=382380 RepID=A0ABD3SBJ1_9STRA